jgi:hypothetical protein
MIDLRETKIFKRKMPQTVDRVVGSELASADLLEQLADGFGVQESVLSRSSFVVSNSQRILD